VAYESFQASEDATPLRVARSKALFSEERWVGKQVDHNRAEDFGQSILGPKTVNDILQKLWNLKVREAVRGWCRAAVHPSGQGREREENVHKFLGTNIFAVNNT
jgi:hypothetical protein